MKKSLYCGVKIDFEKSPCRPREIRECGECKNSCIGQFVDDELKDCKNFIPKRISAEEKYLRRMFFSEGVKKL